MVTVFTRILLLWQRPHHWDFFLNGEISWPVFKVITQSTRYVTRFYFSFIVIVTGDANIAVFVVQMIMASRNFFISDN